MRIKLKLSISKGSHDTLLPINYQYELSSAIYKIIESGNKEFSDFLHRKGFTEKNKKFKLFTFSNFYIPKFKLQGDRLKILSAGVSCIISFYPIETVEPFIQGLFQNQRIEIGDRKLSVRFKVQQIEKLREPDFSSQMRFKTLSPMNVSFKPQNKPYAQYLHPEDSRFEEVLIKNLQNKLIAYQKFTNQNIILPEKFNYEIKPDKQIKTKLITIKKGSAQESKIKGFDFSFSIKAPVELIRIGYYAGFGEKNSMGFGCCEWFR